MSTLCTENVYIADSVPISYFNRLEYSTNISESRVKNTYYNFAHDSIKVIVDTQAPTFELLGPTTSGGLYQTGGDIIRVHGFVFDANIAAIEIGTNASLNPILAAITNETFEAFVPVDEATNQITLTFKDLANNITTSTFDISVDFSLTPAIAEVIPETYGGSINGGEKVQIIGSNFRTGMTAKIAGLPLTDFKVLYDGLAEGITPAVASTGVEDVVICDESNVPLVQLTGGFEYKPTFTITGLDQDNITYISDVSGQVNVTFNASGFTADEAKVTVISLSGESVSTTPLTGSSLTVQLQDENENLVIIKLKDTTTGEETEQTFSSVWDTTDPVIPTGGGLSGSLTAGKATASDTVTLFGSLTEKYLKKVTVNGVEAEVNGNTWKVKGISLPNYGPNDVEIVAEDASGRVVTRIVQLSKARNIDDLEERTAKWWSILRGPCIDLSECYSLALFGGPFSHGTLGRGRAVLGAIERLSEISYVPNSDEPQQGNIERYKNFPPYKLWKSVSDVYDLPYIPPYSPGEYLDSETLQLLYAALGRVTAYQPVGIQFEYENINFLSCGATSSSFSGALQEYSNNCYLETYDFSTSVFPFQQSDHYGFYYGGSPFYFLNHYRTYTNGYKIVNNNPLAESYAVLTVLHKEVHKSINSRDYIYTHSSDSFSRGEHLDVPEIDFPPFSPFVGLLESNSTGVIWKKFIQLYMRKKLDTSIYSELSHSGSIAIPVGEQVQFTDYVSVTGVSGTIHYYKMIEYDGTLGQLTNDGFYTGVEAGVDGITSATGETVTINVIELDLDIDSDNNNGLASPARDNSEDQIESDTSKIGKVVPINHNDDDNDEIPDYADLDVADDKSLIPMVFEVKPTIDWSVVKFKFVYQGSSALPNATALAGVDVVHDTKTYKDYSAAQQGNLRIWNIAANTEARDASKYIVPNQEYTAADLGYTGGVKKFFIEGINAIDSTTIELKISVNDNEICDDKIVVSVIKGDVGVNTTNDVAFSINDEDEKIEDQQEGFVFWPTRSEDAIEELNDIVDAFNNGQITPRTLVDLLPVKVDVPQSVTSFPNNFKVNIEIKNLGNGTMQGTPHFNVYENQSPANNRIKFLQDSQTGQTQLSENAIGDLVFDSDVTMDPSHPECLLQARGDFFGKVKVIIYLKEPNTDNIIELDSAIITYKKPNDLLHAVSFRGAVSGGVSYPTDEGRVVNNYAVHPSRSVLSGYGSIDSNRDQILVLVHGYNVDLDGAKVFWKEMVKRFYWVGYRGNLVGVSWQGDEGGSVIPDGTLFFGTNLENALQTSWNLGNYLKELKDRVDNNYDVNVVAHSMGNLAVMDALRILGIRFPNTKIIRNMLHVNAAVWQDTLASKNDFLAGTGQIYTVDEQQRVSWYHWFREYDIPIDGLKVNSYNPEDGILQGAMRLWQVITADSSPNIWEPFRSSNLTNHRTPFRLWHDIPAWPTAMQATPPLITLFTDIRSPMGAANVTDVVDSSNNALNQNWDGLLSPIDSHSSWYVKRYDEIYDWFSQVFLPTIDN